MEIELILTVTPLIAGGIWGWWKYRDEKKKNDLEIENLELENKKLKEEGKEKRDKLNFYDEVIKIVFYNSISDAVWEIFNKTKADRFLIKIARNGSKDPKYVDVMLDFFKYSEHKIDAVKVYKNVSIDPPYKKMLKDSEFIGFVDLETKAMEAQIWKHYYESEEVKFVRIRPVIRMPVDDNNDFLVFTSVATHSEEPFTDSEKSIIDLYHNNTINPSIKSLLNTQ